MTCHARIDNDTVVAEVLIATGRLSPCDVRWLLNRMRNRDWHSDRRDWQRLQEISCGTGVRVVIGDTDES
jgi:hypothetical protein